MITVGNKVAEIRKTKNLSQNKLSKISGVSRTYLIEIEEDKYNITVDILCKLSKALNCTPNDLIPEHLYK